MTARPHVSDAIVQLRRWVTMCAAAVCVAAIVQMVVFGVVHYTNARWTTAEAPLEEPNLTVVNRVNPGQTVSAGTDLPGAVARPPVSPIAAKPVRVPSRTDGYMRALSGVSITVGLIGVSSMALLSMLGVAVAAGANVPGMAHTVRASVWSLILAMACVPWGQVIASAALPGMFSGYEQLCDASERAKGGGEFGLHMQMLGLPLLGLVVAPLICLWFRQGVAAGYVYTHVSEMEEALDHEMAVLRERGATSLKGGATRAGGALNLAMAEQPVPLARAAGAESMSQEPGISPSLLRPRRINEPSAGEAPKRPI